MPRQIWTNFLVQKIFRLLGRETQSVQEGRKQTISTGTKLDNGRADFNQFIRLRNQLVVAVRDFSKEEKSAPCASETTSKRHGRAAQTYTQSCRSC